MVLDCVRKPNYPKRSNACTGRTCRLRPGFEPRTVSLHGHSATSYVPPIKTIKVDHYLFLKWSFKVNVVKL